MTRGQRSSRPSAIPTTTIRSAHKRRVTVQASEGPASVAERITRRTGASYVLKSGDQLKPGGYGPGAGAGAHLRTADWVTAYLAGTSQQPVWLARPVACQTRWLQAPVVSRPPGGASDHVGYVRGPSR